MSALAATRCDGFAPRGRERYHGTVLVDGRYQLLASIGKGGMGEVHDAIDERTGRRVAIKLIDVDQQERREQALRRFEIEARAAAALDSPHIAKVFDIGTDADTGKPYLVLERLEGIDLQRLIARSGALEPDVVARIVAQAAAALAVAHEAGIIHRDVKPANIFICDAVRGSVRVKVLDFGVAKAQRELVGTENVGLTSTGHLLGTPLYMSPEQAVGAKTIDARSDVWSLGVVLFTALTGREPFRKDTLGRVLLSVCTAPLPLVQEVAPWVPPDLAEVVHRAFRRAPEDRFQTAEALRLALIACTESGKPTIGAGEIAGVSAETRARVAPRIAPPDDAPFLGDGGIGELLQPALGGDPALSTRGSDARRADAPPPRASLGSERATAPVVSTVEVPAEVSAERRPTSGRRGWAAAAALVLLLGGLWIWRAGTLEIRYQMVWPSRRPAMIRARRSRDRCCDAVESRMPRNSAS